MSRRAGRGAALVLAILGAAWGGRPLVARPAPPAADAPGTVTEALVQAFADALAARTGATEGPVALAYTARGAEGDAPAAGELGRLVERLLTGALPARGLASRVVPVPSDPALARAAAREAGAVALLEVQLTLLGPRLVLAGTRTPLGENFWTGRPAAAPQALQAAVLADADTRLLARAAPGAQPTRGDLRLVPLLAVAGRPLAVAVGDADGDGRPEGVALTDQTLTLFRLEGRETTVVARRALDAVPAAAAPARDPAGGVVVTRLAGTPAVAYHHTGLAHGEILGPGPSGLRFLAEVDEVPLAARGETVVWAHPQPGRNRFQGRLRVARRGEPPRWVESGEAVVAAALAPDGTVSWVGSDWRPGSEAAPGDGPERVGAGLALADLAGDGQLRVLFSAPVPPGTEDRLWVAERSGALVEERTVPGALVALAAGDLTGDGRDDVLIAAGGAQGGWLYLLTGDRP